MDNNRNQVNMAGTQGDNPLDAFRWIIPRIINNGASYADVMRVFRTAYDHETWYKEWMDLGRYYEESADNAFDIGNTVTAGEHWNMASTYYRTAQFIVYKDTPNKRNAYGSSVRCYKKALNTSPFLAEAVEINVGQKFFPGYLTVPSETETLPVVLVLHGADSTKEETHSICENFWKRGLATLVIDGPGQAEARLRGHMMNRTFYIEACSAAIDYLESHPRIQNDKIAIWGQCLGGYLAMAVAAHEPRIKACASLSAFYYLDTWLKENIPPAFKKNCMYDFGVNTLEELKDKAKEFTLQDVITKIRCPLFIVHSTGDHLVPASEAEQIYNEAVCPKDIKIYEGSVHCCSDIIPQVRPLMVDWIKNKL
ncbi:MAG: alpha/beta hydrolase [Bacillota bacterium]|nr:alpha/beta hydrolase [Bacillota bacterium]